MIGMAHIQDDYPLYYDAVNEKGLCIAGLNFVGNAVYPPVTQGVASVPQYALIPWLLGTCATVAEARRYARATRSRTRCWSGCRCSAGRRAFAAFWPCRRGRTARCSSSARSSGACRSVAVTALLPAAAAAHRERGSPSVPWYWRQTWRRHSRV